jgi:hypothetical protein
MLAAGAADYMESARMRAKFSNLRRIIIVAIVLIFLLIPLSAGMLIRYGVVTPYYGEIIRIGDTRLVAMPGKNTCIPRNNPNCPDYYLLRLYYFRSSMSGNVYSLLAIPIEKK